MKHVKFFFVRCAARNATLRSLRAIIALSALAGMSFMPTYGQTAGNQLMQMSTTLGEIKIELNSEAAPVSARNFVEYVESGYFDGLIFHRVIPGFMVQGGGFTDGMQPRKPGAPIQNEADNGLKNLRGTLAMARTSDPNSATAQFFINLVDNAFLDHTGKTPQGWGYAVFGKVASGMDVVDKIAAQPTGVVGGYQDVPNEPIVIIKAAVSDHTAAQRLRKAPDEYEGESVPRLRDEVAQSDTTDAGQANRLMIKAVKAMDAVKLAPSTTQKIALLQQAHEYLMEIIERFPSTDLAVKLVTGQSVGDISLTGVRKAMNEAQEVGSLSPGTPVNSWRHDAAIVAVSLSANDRHAVTASSDGIITVRNLDTGEILRTWQHQDNIVAAAFSQDGRRLATANWDGIVAVWNTRSGKRLFVRQYDKAGTDLSRFHRRGAVVVKSIDISSNGQYVLVANGVKAHTLDARTGKTMHTWDQNNIRRKVWGVAYSPDGQKALLMISGGRMKLKDAGNGQTLRAWKHPGSGSGSDFSAAFSPDGRRVAIAVNETVVLHDVDTGKDLRKWYPSRNVLSIAYSPDGRRVLVGTTEDRGSLFDVKKGKVVHTWRYNTDVTAVAFSEDGKHVLLGADDGFVILCDTKAKRTLNRLAPDGECSGR